MIKCKDQRGFTLIEVIVVAAIIAILAGILVPMIFNQIDESKTTELRGNIKSMESAMIALKGDTKSWPVRSADSGACAEDVDILRGKGNMPARVDATAATWGNVDLVALLGDQATGTHGSCYTNFKGPYLTDAPADPWGNSILIFTNGFRSTVSSGRGPVWILSAGPNGTIDTLVTDPTVTAPAVDDIGKRVQ